jgi:Leu/Phe-tRNA-protein transferase
MSIEAMKQALEALEQVKPLYTKQHAIAALRQAIEQVEKQEPVAWMRQDGQRVTIASDRHNYPDGENRYLIPLYTTPQPQLNVATNDMKQECVAKPQEKLHEWIDLTRDEIWEVYKKHDSLQYMAFARAIEQSLKEKNSQ